LRKDGSKGRSGVDIAKVKMEVVRVWLEPMQCRPELRDWYQNIGRTTNTPNGWKRIF